MTLLLVTNPYGSATGGLLNRGHLSQSHRFGLNSPTTHVATCTSALGYMAR